MALIGKESLMPIRTDGRKRSKRLANEDEGTQLQSATLEIKGPKGEIHYFLQVKFWMASSGYWTMAIFDANGSLVALVGPRKREDACWQACVEILKAKGYWGGD